MEINEFELNGKLLEISVILNCDVFKLIQIKNEIVKKGQSNADDLHQLFNLGFPTKGDFFDNINYFVKENPICTNGYISSLLFAFRKNQNTQSIFVD